MQAGADFKYEVHYMCWLLVLSGHCHYYYQLIAIYLLFKTERELYTCRTEALQFIWVLQRDKSAFKLCGMCYAISNKIYKFVREYNLKITGLVDLISSSSISFVSWDCLSDVT
jgi:hypothetical protein